MKKLMGMLVMGMVAALWSGSAQAVAFEYKLRGLVDENGNQRTATLWVDAPGLEAEKTMETDTVLSATPITASATEGVTSQAVVLPSTARKWTVRLKGTEPSTAFVEAGTLSTSKGKGGNFSFQRSGDAVWFYIRPSPTGTTIYLNVVSNSAAALSTIAQVVYTTK
mgnify:FL=1